MRQMWMWTAITLCIAALALPAFAQRRPIGAASQPASSLPDGDDASNEAEQKRKKAEQEKKAAEQKKAEQERQKVLDAERKREAAEEAARKAAAEAARKKAEAEARKQKAAADKKKAEDEKRRREELNAGRAERVLVRTADSVRLRISLRPGAPEIKAVEEVRLDVAEVLKVPDPSFGEFKPITDADLVATVSFVEPPAVDKPEPKKAKGAQPPPPPPPVRYRLHALYDAGVYGFHVTLLQPGQYRIEIEGKDAKGRQIGGSFDLYPGVWPPPDWDSEKARTNEGTGRRRPIGG
ncbi:MAG: hypothetical protein JXR83_08930 [Deltaproteobacteria bacterium]|nr:hypothetical protein [Deltaproteobacteria bacterium]